MKPDTIQVPAHFVGFGSRVDGGASLRFATNELTADDFGKLKEMLNSFGYVLFSPNQFNDDDLPPTDAPGKVKTPSQRLRSVLFVYWNKKKEPKDDFEGFYRKEMAKFINHVKDAIEE